MDLVDVNGENHWRQRRRDSLAFIVEDSLLLTLAVEEAVVVMEVGRFVAGL